MKQLALVATLTAVACGGGRTCNDAFGQDCGPTMNVTLRWAAAPLADGGVNSASCICTATATMPSAQFFYAVERATMGCQTNFTSPSSATIECCTSGCGPCVYLNPQAAGVDSTFCTWTPPLLSP